MANQVDRRVVEMRFDNKDFEKNIGQTLISLDELEKTLNMKPMTTGAKNLNRSLLDIGQSAKSIDTSALANNIETISNRFSTLGVIGSAMLQKVGWAVADLGFTLKNKLMAPLSIIKEKGLSRALDIEQAQFQIKGLGLDVEEVMKNANDAVSGTAYGLNEAAKAASVLGASGIKAGSEMEAVLTSIAGAAAMTGRSYADIADIYSTVASNGKLMTQQLRQFSASGLNVSAVLAKAFNKTEEEINDMVSKGKISFKEFSEAMMSFGEHAKAANDTFSGSLSNMKAALGRIGASFYQPMLVHARDVFNALTPAIDNVHNALKPLFKYMDTIAGNVTEKLTAKLRELTSHLDVIGRVGRFKFGGSWDAWTGVLKNTDTALKITMDDVDSLGKKADETWGKLTKHFNKSEDEVKKMVKSGKVSYADYAQATGKVMKMTFEDVANLQKKGVPAWTMLTRSLVKGTVEAEKAFKNGEISQKEYSKAMQKAQSEIEEKLKKGEVSWADYTKATEKAKLSLDDLYEIGGEHGINTIDLLSKSLEKSKEEIVEMAKEGKISFADLSKAMEKAAKSSLTDGSLSIENLIKALNMGFIVRNMEQFKTILQAGKDVAILFKDALAGLFDVLSGGGGESALQAAAATLVHFVAFLASGVSKAIEFGRSSGAFKKVHDILLKINDILFMVIDRINYYASVIVNFVKETGILNAIFGALGKSASVVGKTLSDIFSGFSNIGSKALSKAGEAFAKIAEALGSLRSKAGGVKDILKPILDVFVSIADAGSSALAKTVHNILDAFSGGVSKLASAVGTGALAAMIWNLWKALSSFGKVMNQKGGPLGQFMALFTGDAYSKWYSNLFKIDNAIQILVGNLKHSFATNELIKMAIALGVLALACKGLAKIDTGSLIKSVTAIAAMFKLLQWASTSITSKLKTGGFIKLAITIAILTSAVKKLSELENMGTGVAGVGLLMAELVGLCYAFKKLELSSKGLGKAGLGFILIAESLNIMSKPVARLAQLDSGQLVKGLASVAIIMEGLIIFMKQISTMPIKNALAASFSMTVMAIALTAMVAPIALLGKMKLETLVKGIGSLVVVIAAITGSMILMGRYGKNAMTMASVGPAMVAMAKAINIMLPAIFVFSQLSVGKLVKGIGAIVVLLAAFAGFGIALGSFIWAAPMLLVASGALLVTAVAINAIALAIATMGNTEHVWKGIAALGVTLVTLALGVTAMTFAAVGAPVLLIVAAALTILAPAIALLSGLPFMGIVGGMLGLAVALGIFAGAAVLLLPAMPAMLALAGVIALMGAGMAALGVGVSLLAVAFASGISVIVEGCKQLAIGLPIIAQGILDFLGVLLDGVSTLAPKLASAIGTTLQVIIIVLYQYMPQFIQLGLTLLIKLLEGMRSKIGEVTDLAIDIIITFVNALGSRVQDVVDAGFNLIINFINGMADSIATNGPILIDAMKNLIASVLEVIAGEIPIFGDYAADAIAKYRKGLNKGGEGTKKEAKSISTGVNKNLKIEDQSKNSKKASESLKKGLDKKGVTKVAKEISTDSNKNMKIPSQYNNGANAVQGLINGMDALIPDLKTKSKEVADIVDETIKKRNEIESPSKRTFRTGKYLMQGLILGVDSLTNQYKKKAENISTIMISSLDSTRGSMAGIGKALSSPLSLSTANDITKDISVNTSVSMIFDKQEKMMKNLTDMIKQSMDNQVSPTDIYNAVREGASEIEVKEVSLNGRELKRGLRSMGVVTR